ncbi:MAG: hypothetical protein NTX50_31460 [Candidatus Sumerlaeota bacterium]|nr:hypothetical protein [Candidatus Sumerlaeota bacterium]
MDISEIEENGFQLRGSKGDLANVALLSLRVALKAYFSTYKTMKYFQDLLEPGCMKAQKDADFDHSIDYCEAYIEAILHFQHFIEIFCKDVPRSAPEPNSKKPLGFLEGFKRLCSQIEANPIDRTTYGFLPHSKDWIVILNMLRNKIWHRDAFVLVYPALDHLVGCHILPFVECVTALPHYQGMEADWKYKNLFCKIDPLTEIIKSCGTGDFDIERVAILKEMGRAGYECPFYQDPLNYNRVAAHLDDPIRNRVERAAKLESEHQAVSKVDVCPVCGSKSLIVYDDVQSIDPTEENSEQGICHTWQIECRVCSFSIDDRLKNASDYGLPIPIPGRKRFEDK